MENPVDQLLSIHKNMSTRQLVRNLGCSKRKLKYFTATSMHCAKADPIKYGSLKKGIRVYQYSPEASRYTSRFNKKTVVKPVEQVQSVQLVIEPVEESESSDSEYEIINK